MTHDGRVSEWFANLQQEADGGSASAKYVIEEAKRIVVDLRDRLPPDTDVYWMDGDKIAVELFGEAGCAFLLVCESGGSALCVVTADGVSRRSRYKTSQGLPDNFVREGIGDVRRREEETE